MANGFFSWVKVLKNNPIRNHIYISTDNLFLKNFQENNHNFKLINYPNNLSWTSALEYSLDELNQKGYTHLITSFEDLIITDFNSTIFEDILSFPKEVDYFKLICSHLTVFRFFRKKRFSPLENNNPYIGSLVLALWRINSLQTILAEKSLQGCTPWEYEKKVGSVFKNLNFKAYTVNRMVFKFRNICIKGFLMPTETHFAKKEIGFNKEFRVQKLKYLKRSEEAKHVIKVSFFIFLKKFLNIYTLLIKIKNLKIFKIKY